MFRVAVKMLFGDRVKYIGLLFGIAFTSFLVTFAGSYFAGFLTRSFALVAENPRTDVWVMDPAVRSVEPTTNLPSSTVDRVRSVEGVATAAPLVLGTTDVRFPNGRFQSFQIIGVDDATLAGLPPFKDGVSPIALRTPDSVAVARGGTSDKLQTPLEKKDQWYDGPPHLDVPTRTLRPGDDLLVNDHRVTVVARATALPRYPARPLLYTTYSNALRILPPERRMLTFVLATATLGVTPADLAARIESRTGFRARSSADFKADTVRWTLANSEDVGDVETMLSIAILIGFGVTGVLLYMFTNENLKQYAVLKAMGITPRLLLTMIFIQTGLCAVIGTGLGLGLCVAAGWLVAGPDYPFRLMWFTPIAGGLMVLVVAIVSAAISARPVLKLDAGMVFAGR